LAINKHHILETIGYPGIDIGPGDIFLDPAMAPAFDLPWAVPEKNRPPTDGNVPPYPIAVHFPNEASTMFAPGA